MFIDILRRYKLRSLLRSPLRRILRWGRPRYSAKSLTPPSILPPTCPPRHRRRRVRTSAPRILIRAPNPSPLIPVIPVTSDRDPWQAAERLPVAKTLSLSITDLYRAVSQTFAHPQFDSSDADRAILRKIRSASIKHELIAGVKRVEARIETTAEENEAIEGSIRDPRKGVELDQNVAGGKMQVRQSKRLRAKLVKAALHGRRIRLNAPANHIARWNWYEAAWAAIEAGHLGRSIRCSISFNDLPWPTLNVNRLELEDYEAFVLSPARPRFETMYWFERVKNEHAHWNLDNVKQKVIPLVSEEISERVMGCAVILLGYLDSLVDKYTSCDE
ncbi:hypothetical protein PM082_022280 [Marasmius tenuissimus]|nr:hypothetical protein PM082_022280 [Marasmius tenuissimus]